MLEFAYTGEVNVAKDLLPTLLQTARALRIKGLDKVENPLEAPPPPPPPPPQGQNQDVFESTRSHSPSSIHSQQDVKPPQPQASFPPEHFLGEAGGKLRTQPSLLQQQQQPHTPLHLQAAAAAALQPQSNSVRRGGSAGGGDSASPPRSLPGSQPPTRESSPCPQQEPQSAASNSRTPPPKRWKRSFDMTQPTAAAAAVVTAAANGHKENGEPMVRIMLGINDRVVNYSFALQDCRELLNYSS